MLTVTATDLENSFEKYLDLVIAGQEIVITKNGKEVARLTPTETSRSSLSDSLRGVLKKQYDIDEERTKSLKDKNALTD